MWGYRRKPPQQIHNGKISNILIKNMGGWQRWLNSCVADGRFNVAQSNTDAFRTSPTLRGPSCGRGWPGPWPACFLVGGRAQLQLGGAGFMTDLYVFFMAEHHRENGTGKMHIATPNFLDHLTPTRVRLELFHTFLGPGALLLNWHFPRRPVT